jgi:hypothetical protein
MNLASTLHYIFLPSAHLPPEHPLDSTLTVSAALMAGAGNLPDPTRMEKERKKEREREREAVSFAPLRPVKGSAVFWPAAPGTGAK